jgi:flagellar biosynthesis GTPase FlhF
MDFDALIESNITVDDAAPADDAELPAIEPDEEELQADSDDDERAEDDTETPEAGSQEAPLSVKELSEERFIEIKVGDEKVVVSEKELANGHIRQRDFSRRVNELRDQTKRTTEIAEKAEERVQAVKNSVHSLFSNPERTFSYMSEHFPDQLEKVARTYAEQHIAEQKLSPEERLKRVRERDAERHQKQLAAERRRREEVEAEQRARSAAADARALIEAPHRRAFAAAGSPVLSGEARAAFQTEAKRMLKLLEEEYGRTPPEEEIEKAFGFLYERHGTPAEAETPEAPPKPRRASGKRRRRTKKTQGLRESSDGTWDFSHLED